MRCSLWIRTVNLCSRSLTNNATVLSENGTRKYLTDNGRKRRQNIHISKRRFSSSAGSEEIIFKSPCADGTFPEVSMSDYMFSRFEKFGDKEAMFDDATGNSYKYSQIRPLAEKIGSFLTRQGFVKNDVICYFGTNHPEFTLLLLGCSSAGVILTTANPAITADEVKRHMEHSEAKKIVTIAALVPKVQEAGIPNENIIVLGQADGCMPFAHMLTDDGKGLPQHLRINPREDVAILPYSSGTTGLPKGVMLTHYNVVSNLLQFKDTHITDQTDTNFGLLPFFHIYGLAPINLGTLQDGGRLVTTPIFDPEKFLISLQKHKVTKLHIVPPIILFLARHPIVAKFDLSSIREVVSAAAPLGISLTHEFTNRLNLPIVQGYGLTETSPVVSLDTVPAHLGSIGQLIMNTEAKIIDTDTGKCLGRNEVGELAIRGPQNMKGYLKNEQATKDMIDEQGWLHTGDSAYVTDDDYLFICDRLKELIKYKGLQVAPAELENLIHQHPAVQDVTVLGVPDERAGEVPKAFVVLKPKRDVTESDIQNYIDGKVSDYKKLRGGVEFIDEIPKSPSGKILRRLLKERK